MWQADQVAAPALVGAPRFAITGLVATALVAAASCDRLFSPADPPAENGDSRPGSAQKPRASGETPGSAASASERAEGPRGEGEGEFEPAAASPSAWEPSQARGEELEPRELARLLARLPELRAEEGDRLDFLRPEASMPPPRPGEEVKEAWPPDPSDRDPEAAEPQKEGPLAVTAVRPEGEVEPPFQLALSFDRPVVEVGAVGEQDAPPAEIAPAVEGRWRWLGTRTAVFEPKEGWPMATEFDALLRADLEAQDGASLSESVSFSFATPPPEVINIVPGSRYTRGARPRDAPVAVVFNQPVHPASASAITITDEDDVPMARAGDEARAEIAERYGLEEAESEGRVLALEPKRDYAYDATVEVRASGPIRSREGPVRGEADERRRFRVHGPFQLTEADCRGREPCRPGAPVRLRFSNSIDADAAEPRVSVTPEAGDLHVRARGSRLTVEGDFHPHTDYALEIEGELRDEFGQALEGERAIEISFEGYRPVVAGPENSMVLRSRDQSPEFPILAAGVREFRARIFDVSAEDWSAFRDYQRRRRDDPGGELVAEESVSISERKAREPRMHHFEVDAALEDGLGHAVIALDLVEPWDRRREFRAAHWMQRTDLAADFTSDRREMSARVTHARTGAPVPGARIWAGEERLDQTGTLGHAAFSAPTGREATAPLSIRRGDHELLLPAEKQRPLRGRSLTRRHRRANASALWHVVDDRQVYKPGERVRIRGWLRELEREPASVPARADADSVSYTVREPRRNEIASGEAELDAAGGFELDFEVPEAANLGSARIELRADVQGRGRHVHTVEFQEFRRPEYEVEAHTGAGPHLAGDATRWEVEASYYAGGGLAEAPVEWNFAESSARYDPPGWRDWNFGPHRVWWLPGSGPSGHVGGVLPEGYEDGARGETDARGSHAIEIPFEEPGRGFPRRVQAQAAVKDVDRQRWEDGEDVLVHPAEVYVGLRSEKNTVERGEAWELEAVVVDIDGAKRTDHPLDIELRRERGGERETVAACTRRSDEEPQTCAFSDMQPGDYRAIARAEDERGRISESELRVSVVGQDRSGAETAEEDELVLIPERDDHAPGDTAQIAVDAPYYPLDAIVELRRDGAYKRAQKTITRDEPAFEFGITKSMIPNVHVRVTAIGKGEGYAPERFASGELEIDVDPGPRELDIDIRPHADVIEPGAELKTAARVTDHRGAPVENAQVLLYAVDESVLALSDYDLADPIEAFYPARRAGTTDLRSRDWLLTEDDLDLDRGASTGRRPAREAGAVRTEARGEAAPADDAEEAVAREAYQADSGDETDDEAMQLREVFEALAFYRTDLRTDEDGEVRISEPMPESLTRYRIMAVAVRGDAHFGSAENDVRADKLLQVSPSPPRFLNVGDHFELSVTLRNRTDEPIETEAALRENAALDWLAAPGRRVRVPAEDRVEIRFPARALEAGTGRLQIAAAGGGHTDAETVKIPILTPATTEAFATYGAIDAGDDDAALEAVATPEDVYPQYGGLEISASSTRLHALTDAFIHLIEFDFEFAEPLASRILSVLALYDVLEAFDGADVPDPDALRSHMTTWIDDLAALQREGGGFGTFPTSRRSHPMVTAHALHALARADAEGYDIGGVDMSAGRRYLESIEDRVNDYSDRAAASVEAYALRALSAMDALDDGRAGALIARYGAEDLPLEAAGWLLPIVSDSETKERLLERITGQVQETAATAEFQETYERGAGRILHTDRRTDGVILDGLLQTRPAHPLIDKVVRGLLGHRERGRWKNTQENVFISMALRRFFDTHEDVRPDFVARAWLGERAVAEHEFAGHTAERYGAEVPMSYLQNGPEEQPVVVQRDGEGRMYYRLGLRYAPTARELAPRREGFTVERSYRATGDPDDVRRTEEGWEIRAGAEVEVELSMSAPARRNHVALVDWLPAGLEIRNPALEVTSDDRAPEGSDRRARGLRRWAPPWGPWFEHQNLRDERAEAFASQVREGVYSYSYKARATTPGEFRAMPAKAKELYHPETFGRSASEIVRVVKE